MFKKKSNEQHATKIREELIKIGFGNPLVRPADTVELNILEDAKELWCELIDIGRAENQHLFRNKVEVVVTDTDTVNASAFSIGKTDVVAVTKGLLFGLHNLFNELLCHPKVLVHVGVAEKERPHSENGDVLRRQPRCLQRREFAAGALRRALEFILVHELAHHFYGHFQYLRQLGLRELTCLRMAESSLLGSPNEFQALEIQADRHAADVSLTRAIDEATWADGWNLVPQSQQSPPLEHVAIQEWAFAVAGILHLVAHITEECDTHPHPNLRLIVSASSAMEIIEARNQRQRQSSQLNDPLSVSPLTFLKLANDTFDRLDKAWIYMGRPAQTRVIPSEEFFRDLMYRAVVLHKKLPSRFPKDHVI